MRISTTAMFKDFLKEYSGAYPYSQIKVTRQSFYLEWVFLRSNWYRTAGVMRLGTQWFPVHCSCLPKEHLEELLMTGQALPVPAEMEEVVHSMFVWGQSVSYYWFCETIDLLANLIENGVEVDKATVVRAVIKLLVKYKVESFFAVGSVIGDTIKYNWKQYFEGTYMKTHMNFYAMAYNSLDYTNNCIAMVQNHGVIPVPAIN